MARDEKKNLVQQHSDISFPKAIYGMAEPGKGYPNPKSLAWFIEAFKKQPMAWSSSRSRFDAQYRDNRGKNIHAEFYPTHYPGVTNEQQMRAAYEDAVAFRKAKVESGEASVKKKAELK
jgi:hypothetical protein